MKKKASPVRVSHVGVQTYNVERIRDWYCNLLNGEVVFQKIPLFCTVTFDDEHHRIAIVGMQGEPKQRQAKMPGLSHIAFTLGDIFDLLENYERARDLGITPKIVLNHGPTVSMYYFDPDNNEVELLVDRFKTGDEAKAFMHGPIFAKTLGAGGHFDPEVMLARMKAGATEEELLHYDEEAVKDVNPAAEIAHAAALRDAPVS